MAVIPTHLAPGSRVAVVGSGIAGLSAAWLLNRRYRVTLFEAGDYLGGHTNTVDAEIDGLRHPVDTGFLVHNEVTYPNLIALFKTLGVATHESDMSFGVSVREPDIEWAGTNIRTVFAQPRNMVRPAFLGMLRDIARLNREAAAYVAQIESTVTLRELLDTQGYGRAMRDWYLLPMAAAIWSTSIKDILDFPARTFLVFCLNHHLLQIEGRPKWRTVAGGARSYVQAMTAGLPDIRLNCPVQAVRRGVDGLRVHTADGPLHCDAVVLACHAPASLAMLDASPAERAVLGAFRYQPNRAVLHTDVALLPRRRSTWSAWNYLAEGGHTPEASGPVAVSYLLNMLQPLPFKRPVIVTLNPTREPAAGTVLRTFDYEHPVFDVAAIQAQARVADIQGRDGVYFCGAWTRYGFHEDGLRSGMDVASRLGVTAPWKEAICQPA